MIPVINVQEITVFFQLVVTFSRLRRLIRDKNENTENLELIIILKLISQVLSAWLRLFVGIYKLMAIKSKRKKFMKPLLLIQMLAGYRSV